MSKKNFIILLISLSPLIVLINLLPFFSSINPKLLFGLELELLGFLFLKYRKRLVRSIDRAENGHFEMGRTTYNLRIILGIVFFFGMGIFLLLSYVLEVVKR